MAIKFHGFHLYPQLAHLFTVLPEPINPVNKLNPRCPAVIEVEPHLGHLVLVLLS